MPTLLHIDTATQFCSVALSIGGRAIEIRSTNEKNAHSKVITTFIDDVLKNASRTLGSLDAICISMGPGSYTGLRIGVSTAKGLCYAIDKPLIAVSTLQAMANGMTTKINGFQGNKNEILFCPMIDARRMEVYSAIYDKGLKEVRGIRAEIIEANSFSEYMKGQAMVFAGDGAEKCKSLFLNQPNAVFLDDFEPSAAYMVSLAVEKYFIRKFEDVAYFEPFYLKDFIAGIPKVKGLYT
nr:tRNA (adenosine(37)-N6)-threonylcarbamoyltransferase complex dimerization subunit type 1 TsaB [Bacteroidota bacterium]